MIELRKYPRTHHIQGSRLQPGDEDLSAVPFSQLRSLPIVVEEKVDGANAGISFDEEGRLRLQSRGHFLTGGDRERHFNLLKRWASAHEKSFYQVLRSRYILYGEWLYAKHTIFYDQLPHYFLEFDVLDKETGTFLSTHERRSLLLSGPLPLPICQVPVLYEGPATSLSPLLKLIGPSRFKSPDWQERLRAECAARPELSGNIDRVVRETDPLVTMEGLYIKVEEEGRVIGRYKYIRPSFLTAVLASEGHWLNRPILPNQLAEGVDLFAVHTP